MGQTKFQQFLFTLIICFMMVLGMSLYNLWLIHGTNTIIFSLLIKQFIPVLILALALDLLIAAPFAKKFMLNLIKPKTKVSTILTISLSMIFVMVLLMSAFGSIMANGFTYSTIIAYPSIILQNAIVAIPLNLLFVGPIARVVHLRLFPVNFS